MLTKTFTLSFQKISFLIQTTQWYLFKEEKKKKDALSWGCESFDYQALTIILFQVDEMTQ